MTGGKRITRKKPNLNYEQYFKRILCQTEHPEMQLSKETLEVMNSMMNDFFDRISNQASQLVYTRNKKTLTARDIEFATRMVIRGELAINSVSEGQKALRKLKESAKQEDASLSLLYETWTAKVAFHSSPVNSSSSTSSSSDIFLSDSD